MTRCRSPGVDLLYVGHATVLIELDGVRVITDPVLRARVVHLRRQVPLPSLAELLPLDAVLISHAHHDHLDPRSLRRIAHGPTVVAPEGCTPLLRRSGATHIVEVEAGDRLQIGSIALEAVPAAHSLGRYPLGRRTAALGYLLEGSSSVYFAGDTDVFPEMAELAGRANIAVLPISGWGKRVPAGHLDPERAARAAALITPGIAVPIHWGTLRALGAQRGADPLSPVTAFVTAVARLAPRIEVRVLLPGERLS